MKKQLLTLFSAVTILSLSVPVQSASAETSSGLSLIETNSYEVSGEHFEVEIWEDENGIKSYTVGTEVKNKEAVSNFVDDLARKDSGEPEITPSGFVNNRWSKAHIQGRDGDSGSYWTTSGSSTEYIVGLINMSIDKGRFTINWYGSQSPDKIVASYQYKFNGWTPTISFPPSMTKSGDTVSFRSEPVENTWHLTTTTEAASATSVFHTSMDIKAAGEVYVGSRIYMPISTENITTNEI